METQYFLIRIQFCNNTFMSGLCKGLRSEIEISASQRGDRTSKSPGDKVQLWGPPGKHRHALKEVVADCHWKWRCIISVFLWQLRLGDLQAALAMEKSGHQVALHNLELLRAQLREVEQVSNQEKEKSIGFENHLQQWDAKHDIIFFPF